jgi:hypothetical protein
MPVVETPQTRCRAAIARCDITPPIGIYHRMWGAATHDRATGVHKPLLATLLWLAPELGDASQAILIVALDHCILDGPDIELIRRSVAQAANVRPAQVLVTLAHTHAAGLMSRSRSQLPGGEWIGPYLDELAGKVAQLASAASIAKQPSTIVYGQGRCNLATNRDFFDVERNQFVCGFNPDGPADDTILVAKILGDDQTLQATLVNYACHPTTLAWQNTLISPDYVGALRETIEKETAAPCLFLQGASGDLGPREGFVGDPAVADKNGRQLAFAALAALQSLPKPGTQFDYAGPVVSGATIGTWQHQPLAERSALQQSAWHLEQWTVPLGYRPDLENADQTRAALSHWQAEQQRAIEAGDDARARDCHARAEQATRQLWRQNALPPENFPLRITLARLGDAFWLFVPGEHYQFLQTTLRQRFPKQPIIVTTLTDGWQPGYIPPADVYGRGIYQEEIAVVAAGSAEHILQSVAEHIEQCLTRPPGK